MTAPSADSLAMPRVEKDNMASELNNDKKAWSVLLVDMDGHGENPLDYLHKSLAAALIFHDRRRPRRP